MNRKARERRYRMAVAHASGQDNRVGFGYPSASVLRREVKALNRERRGVLRALAVIEKRVRKLATA